MEVIAHGLGNRLPGQSFIHQYVLSTGHIFLDKAASGLCDIVVNMIDYSGQDGSLVRFAWRCRIVLGGGGNQLVEFAISGMVFNGTASSDNNRMFAGDEAGRKQGRSIREKHGIVCG